MDKEAIFRNFDPNAAAVYENHLFGLPFPTALCEVVILPVPWEVTVSYGVGTSKGPEAVFEASKQVDLFHQEFPELWKLGVGMDEGIPDWEQRSIDLKKRLLPFLDAPEGNTEDNPEFINLLKEANQEGDRLAEELKSRVLHWLEKGKLIGLLGGDHSTPLGFYHALAEKYEEFGILHIDAHMDFRKAYEGFTHSHASIMYNALQIPNITKIVQAGIRDFCEEEYEFARSQGERVSVFTDADLKNALFRGKTWDKQCEKIIETLPQNVHISFDIDGLMQWYCPGTGTPVPGGFSYEQACYLLWKLIDSGRKIIGFDLVEVAPGDNEWNGNVGARLLFFLSGILAKSAGRATGKRIEFD